MDFTPHHKNRRGYKNQQEHHRRKQAAEARRYNSSLHSSFGMCGHSFHRPPTYPTPSHAAFSPFVPPPPSPAFSNSSFLFPASPAQHDPSLPFLPPRASTPFHPSTAYFRPATPQPAYFVAGLDLSASNLPQWAPSNGKFFLFIFFPMAPFIVHCLLQKNFIYHFSSVDSRHEQSQLMTPPHRPFQEQEEPPIAGKLLFLFFFFWSVIPSL